MEEYNNLPSLRKYVRAKENKDTKELEEAAERWIIASAKNRLAYEIDWLGVPIIQTPEDIVLMQELIFKIKPDIIVETGIGHGGSLIYYASLLELLGKGKVIGIDIEIKPHNKEVIEKHPLFKRIEILEGDSTSENIINKIKKKIQEGSKVLVCLDSSHLKEHVLKELQLYQELVCPGSYIVVFDTHTPTLVGTGACDEIYKNNSPLEAIEEFLKNNDKFEIDKKYNKLYISYSPNGYLKRIK